MEMIKEYIESVIKNNSYNTYSNGKLNEFGLLVVAFATISLLYSVARSQDNV